MSATNLVSTILGIMELEAVVANWGSDLADAGLSSADFASAEALLTASTIVPGNQITLTNDAKSSGTSAPTVSKQTPEEYYVAGKAFSFTLPSGTFTDPQGQTLTYTATTPSWLTFTASTGTFSGTAPASGSFTITVTATDTSKLSTSESFTLAAAAAPTLAAQTGTQYFVAGKSYSLTLPGTVFRDPQGSTLTYAATLSSGAALPSWLSFKAATETFSGTAPTAGGSYTIKVTATDGYGLSSSETFSLSSAAGPTVTAQTAAQTWTQGSAIKLALPTNTFTDPQGSALTYKATLSTGAALPSWLTFTAATDTFSGTVPTGTANFSLQVTATDTYGLSTSETFAVATPVSAASTSGFVINLIYDSSVTSLETGTAAQQATYANLVSAANAAVSYLEAHFTTSETVNLNFGYGEVTSGLGVSTPIASGSVSESETSTARVSYSTVVNALTAADNASTASADQVASLTSLSGTSSLSAMNFLLPTAEARALGVSTTTSFTTDGGIGLSATDAFTYSASARAVAGDYDAIGAIEHEITEAMGRTGLLNVGSEGYTPLDLFRYTSAGVHDFTQGPGSFSINGTTLLQTYNNPLNGGDTADWASTVTGDTFTSTFAPGVAEVMSNVDLQEMNVLGFARSSLAA